MKRKLALLLAGTMVLSTVSTNTIFAANGEAQLIGNMVVNPKTTTSNVATLTIGDGNQIFTTSASAFTFELVNAKWDTTVADDADDNFKQVFVSGTQYNAVVDASYTGEGNLTFTGNYKVTDASKPAYVKVTSANVPGFQDGKQIQLTTANNSGVNNVTVTDVSGSLSLATGAVVAINSTTKDGVEAGDKYTLTLPSGYAFTDSCVPSVVVKDSLGNVQEQKDSTPYEFSNNRRTLTVTVDTYSNAKDTVFGGSVVISNLDLNNNTSDFNKDVNVTVKKGSTTLSEAKIATFKSFGLAAKVTTATASIPTINAGYDVATYSNLVDGAKTSTSAIVLDVNDSTAMNSVATTAKIKISENIPNSFRGGDLIVTLPEGVTITGFNQTSGSSNVDTNDYTVVLDKDNKNVITIKGLQEDIVGTKFELEFNLEIQTGADFSGDISATISGGKNTVDVINPIKLDKIATVKSVVGVTSTLKEVKAGYTNQPASDIVITEKEAGTFEVGEKITIALTDGFGKLSSNFGFTAADVAVTAGDADIDVDVQNSKVVITIEDINSDKPLQFTVKNVQVYSDRNVPTYNGSDAVKYNVTSTDNLTVAAKGDYIKFVSELSPDAATSEYNNDVKITLNGTSATLADGTKVDLYGAPYISADGNYMAPVKGFAYALGLNAEDIVFDNEDKIATFFLADGSVAQIQAGNKYATVNGQKLPLIDANGNIVTPVIKEGRFYLPLRACAKTMFGVDVSYNATDKSVVLNPSK